MPQVVESDRAGLLPEPGPELEEIVVLYVSTNDPAPPLPDAEEAAVPAARPAAQSG